MTPHGFDFCGEQLVADPSGALLWPSRRIAVVSDLHLGKGQTLAKRGGYLLPPYDTIETLTMLQYLLERIEVDTVLSLGDSFDGKDISLEVCDLARLQRLMSGRTWVWILGNHDPDLPHPLPGARLTEYAVGPLNFRHEASPGPVTGEISGHFHPKAAVRLRGRRIRGRCFVHDQARLILPAFGTYTGGLDITDDAYAELFDTSLNIYLCRNAAVVPVSPARLV